MSLPDNIQRRVAHIGVLTDAFDESIAYWRHKPDAEKRWSVVSQPTQSLLIGADDALCVGSDCNASISAPDGGVLHINGDLNGDLETGGFHEIVIRGNVSANATIRANDFLHVYVGGSVFGRITSTGVSRIWVDGDFPGLLDTGEPNTNINICGDLRGVIAPTVDASLLYLCVDGFAANDLISSIAQVGYIVFHASIGSSDTDPGIYGLTSENGFSRWCVLSRYNRAEPRDDTERR